MVKIYTANTTNFDGTHITEVEPLTGETYEKINGLYTLIMDVPFQNSEELLLDRILEADGQYYRLLRTNKSGSDKSIQSIYGESLFMVDMLDETVDSIFIEDQSLTSTLTDLLAGTLFNCGSCADINVSIASTNLSKAAIINQLINNYQLELELTGLMVALVNQTGIYNYVEIRKGKNLKSIDIEEDISAVITKLIYTNSDESYGNELVSSNASSYSKFKVHYKTFDTDSTYETDLAAMKFLSLNDKPTVVYKIDFADLYYSKEYELVKDLEKVNLGDVVTIIHEGFNIDIHVRIMEIKRDIATRKNTSVVLGNAGSDFFDYQASLQETKETVDYAFTGRKLNAATLKGLKIVNENSDEITFEVTEDGDVNITGDAIIGGTLDASTVNIINFSADSGDVYYLMADNARVSQMAVNEVITMLVEEGKDEYHFIHVHNEMQEWKSAYRKYSIDGIPLPDEQLTDSFGNLLYWTNGAGSGITTEAEDTYGDPLAPVMTHPYDYITKMQIKFDDVQLEDGTYTKAPVIWLGAGTGEGLDGKAKIFKGATGLEINYFSGVDGSLRQMMMDDDGISFTPAFMLFPMATNGYEYTGNEMVMPGIDVTCNPNTMIAFDVQIDIDADSEMHVTAELRSSGEVFRSTIKKFYAATTDQLVFNGVLPRLIPGTHTIDLVLSTSNGTITVPTNKYHLMLTVRGGEAQEAKPWPVANVKQFFSPRVVVLQAPFEAEIAEIMDGFHPLDSISPIDIIRSSHYSGSEISISQLADVNLSTTVIETMTYDKALHGAQMIFTNSWFDESNISGNKEFVVFGETNGMAMNHTWVSQMLKTVINDYEVLLETTIVDTNKVIAFTSATLKEA